MGQAAARSGDRLGIGAYAHSYTTSGATTPYTCDFSASIANEVSGNVFIGNVAAAIANGSSETGAHPALDRLTGGTWAPALVNSGRITGGSATVLINGRPAVRHGDAATCCGATGTVRVANAATATVLIGD